MNKIAIFIFLCISMNLFPATLNQADGFVRKGQTLYLKQDGRSFIVNQGVITVKPKQDSKEVVKEFNVIRSNILDYYDVKVPEDTQIEDFIVKLNKLGAFESIDINTYGSYDVAISDPYFSNQWYLNKINMPSTWGITFGCPSIKIAVLDSGIDTNHPDLGYGYDGYSNLSSSLGNNSNPSYFHGTFVAGIIGAKTNNSTGISGISGGNNQQGVTMIPYCVGTTSPDASVIDDAIISAVTEGAKIIQLSLSVSTTAAINQALSFAHENGVTIVCSSGNNSASSISYPASNSNVIAVGAINANDYRSTYSNYGTGLDIVAPGDNIYSTTLNSSYTYGSGTSFAAPQVSAVASLLLSIKPSLQPDDIRTILNNSATKLSTYTFDNNGWNQEVGHGLLNAFHAVMSCIDIMGSDLLCLSNTYSLEQVPSDVTVTWSLSGAEASNFTVQNNTPSANQCTITRNANATFGSSFFVLNLTANIIHNGDILLSKTKRLEGNTGFVCTYKEPAFSYNGESYPTIPETPLTNCNATYVYPMGQVTLTSGFFRNKNISTSGPYNQFQTIGLETIKFSLVPMSYSTDPLIITVLGQDCDPTVSMTFYPMATPLSSLYSLSISQVSENTFELMLMGTRETEDLFNVMPDISSQETKTYSRAPLLTAPSLWKIELYDTANGKKVLQHEVRGDIKYNLNTQGLESGIYVVNVILDSNILQEKIVIK